MERKIELSLKEMEEFETQSHVRKAFWSLPEGVFLGAEIGVGHWKAEVVSVEHREDELEPVFVIGFRKSF